MRFLKFDHPPPAFPVQTTVTLAVLSAALLLLALARPHLYGQHNALDGFLQATNFGVLVTAVVLNRNSGGDAAAGVEAETSDRVETAILVIVGVSLVALLAGVAFEVYVMWRAHQEAAKRAMAGSASTSEGELNTRVDSIVERYLGTEFLDFVHHLPTRKREEAYDTLRDHFLPLIKRQHDRRAEDGTLSSRDSGATSNDRAAPALPGAQAGAAGAKAATSSTSTDDGTCTASTETTSSLLADDEYYYSYYYSSSGNNPKLDGVHLVPQPVSNTNYVLVHSSVDSARNKRGNAGRMVTSAGATTTSSTAPTTTTTTADTTTTRSYHQPTTTTTATSSAANTTFDGDSYYSYF